MPRQLPKYFSKWGGKPNAGPDQSLASDDELDAITKDVPQLLRIRLAQTLSMLEYCLRLNPHVSENWQELLEIMWNSETELKECIGVRTLPDGTNVEFPMLVDSLCFKYPELKGAVIELGQVLTEIENFDPALYKSVKVSKSLQGERGAKSKRGPKYFGEINFVLEKIIAAKGPEYMRKKNDSDIVRLVQTYWKEGDCPSDSTIRRVVKKKFFK